MNHCIAMMDCALMPLANAVTYQIASSMSNILLNGLQINYQTPLQLLCNDLGSYLPYTATITMVTTAT